MQIKDAMDSLAEIQAYLTANGDIFSTAGDAIEHSSISVTSYDNLGSYKRNQRFPLAIQEFIIHTVNILTYDNLKTLQSLCDVNCDNYQRSLNFILTNGIGAMKDTAEAASSTSFSDFISVNEDGKLVPEILLLLDY